MTEYLIELAQKWNSDWDDELRKSYDGSLFERIFYLDKRLFHQFAPCLSGYPHFQNRLEKWIRNVDDDSDQKLLAQLVPKLFFVGNSEMDALCRQAFVGPFTYWFYQQTKQSWESEGLDQSFQSFIKTTWFCPLTDSFPIAHFCHINKIAGQTHRPDWRSLQKLGDPQKIVSFMHDSGLERIVLLEDFVGTGKQMGSALKFLLKELMPAPETLLIPLVTTYIGDKKAQDLTVTNSNLTYSPVIVIREDECLRLPPDSGPDIRPDYEKQLVGLLSRVQDRLGEFRHSDENRPLGFKNNGALVVMSSNCPSNTPPAVSKESDAWTPLFPRVSRS